MAVRYNHLALSYVSRLRNRLDNARRRRKPLAPWVEVRLGGEIEELPVEFASPLVMQLWSRLLGASASWSVWSLSRLFARLAADSRVQGAVVRLECVAAPSTYQSLRTVLMRFRERGKRLLAYGESFTPFQYYLAAACDWVVMPPAAEWGVTGLASEFVFLKEALDQVGIRAEAFPVSPFKTAFDALTRSDFSAESRAQAEWLLDARFEELVRGIAQGRGLEVQRVRELIDAAPISAEEAVRCGLLDEALYSDQLDDFLKSRIPSAREQRPSRWRRLWTYASKRLPPPIRERLSVPADSEEQLIAPLSRALRALVRLESPPRASEVAVVEIRGLIAEGRSRALPFPSGVGEVSGAEDVSELLRKVGRDPAVKAVVLHVNSGGGSALASDHIAQEVRRLRARKPVVVYMGGVAASGGYYVSAFANAIVAQPLTITGSIGVIALKLEALSALRRLGVNSVVLRRGKRAALLSESVPLDADGREALTRSVWRAYERFKQVVSEGRGLPLEDLEPICGGRVWTGAQALERRLVDATGDLTVAIATARRLAQLPPDPTFSAQCRLAPRPLRWPIGGVLSGVRWLRGLARRSSLWMVVPFVVLPE